MSSANELMVISESMSEDIFELMHSGKIYDPGDERLMKVQTERFRLLKAYNELDPADAERRERMLSSMFSPLRRRLLHRDSVSCKLGRHVCIYRRRRVCQLHPYAG